MEYNEEENNILKEKEFTLISDKNNEYRVKVFITSNDLFCINLFSNNNNLSKKYSLSLSMKDLIKNRFFKMFINLDEVFLELDNKIEKSNIIEDTDLIYLDIPIGLNVINDVILEIKESQKSKDEIIQELQNLLNIKNTLIEQKDNEINQLKNQLNQNNIKFTNEIQQLNNKIEKIKEESNEKIKEIFENIIEIELEIKDNNKEIKIMNDNNIFNNDNTILLLNNKKTNFNNKIKFNQKGNQKLLILNNNNQINNLKDLFRECKELKAIKFIKFNT